MKHLHHNAVLQQELLILANIQICCHQILLQILGFNAHTLSDAPPGHDTMLLVPAVPSFIHREAQTPQNKCHSVGWFFIGVLKSRK
jgi:hypothetical protein